MRIIVVGLGYVGLVTAVELASQGHDVVALDVDATRLALVTEGRSPIAEPGLEEALVEVLGAGTLSVSATLERASGDAVVVCVGTPASPTKQHDYSQVQAATASIVGLLGSWEGALPAVIFKSTVSPGTMEKVVAPLFSASGVPEIVDRLIYSPEFLREGSALADSRNAERTVVGLKPGSRESAELCSLVSELFISPLTIKTTWSTAELAKLADNSWHALKVAFVNELSRISAAADASTGDLFEIFMSGKRLNISEAYMQPGRPFGGSCLRKDVDSFSHFASETGVETPVLGSINRSNRVHQRHESDGVLGMVKPGQRILVEGLAFKSNTGDIRDSPTVCLVRSLLELGTRVHIYDPLVDRTSTNSTGGSDDSDVLSHLVDERHIARTHYDLYIRAQPRDLSQVSATRLVDLERSSERVEPPDGLVDAAHVPMLRSIEDCQSREPAEPFRDNGKSHTS